MHWEIDFVNAKANEKLFVDREAQGTSAQLSQRSTHCHSNLYARLYYRKRVCIQ